MSNAGFTEQEKKILCLMFKNMSNTIEACDGYIDIQSMGFSHNDLYYLFEKLNICDSWC